MVTSTLPPSPGGSLIKKTTSHEGEIQVSGKAKLTSSPMVVCRSAESCTLMFTSTELSTRGDHWVRSRSAASTCPCRGDL